MSEIPSSVSVSTKIDRIATMSKQMPTTALWSLSKHIDVGSGCWKPISAHARMGHPVSTGRAPKSTRRTWRAISDR